MLKANKKDQLDKGQEKIRELAHSFITTQQRYGKDINWAWSRHTPVRSMVHEIENTHCSGGQNTYSYVPAKSDKSKNFKKKVIEEDYWWILHAADVVKISQIAKTSPHLLR